MDRPVTAPEGRPELVVDLLEAAVRTEGKGQLNIGKVLRAAGSAVARAAAAERGFPTDPGLLAADLRRLSKRLRLAGVHPSICDQVALGAEVVSRGGASYLESFPDPYVCRRCGSISDGLPGTSCRGCGAHPLTFERFRPIYWMTEYQPHGVVERLAANPDLFRAAIARLPPDGLRWKAGESAWAAVDVLRHVRDAESLLAERIELILGQTDPPLPFRAVFALTDHGGGEGASADAILDSYVTSRSSSVAALRAVGSDAWMRTGRHEELGRVTLLEQASYFAAHEVTHLRQLEQLGRGFEAGVAP